MLYLIKTANRGKEKYKMRMRLGIPKIKTNTTNKKQHWKKSQERRKRRF